MLGFASAASHEYGDLETGEVLCGCSQVSTFGIGSICIDVTLWYPLVTHIKGSILYSVLLVSNWRYLFET